LEIAQLTAHLQNTVDSPPQKTALTFLVHKDLNSSHKKNTH